jgi:hypothetical protein
LQLFSTAIPAAWGNGVVDAVLRRDNLPVAFLNPFGKAALSPGKIPM